MFNKRLNGRKLLQDVDIENCVLNDNSFGNLIGNSINIVNLNTTNITCQNLLSTNQTITNIASQNITNGNFENITSTNILATNITATNLVMTTGGSISAKTLTSDNSNLVNITNNNLFSIAGQITDLSVINETLSNLLLTNGTINNLVSTNILATNQSITNSRLTNSTITNLKCFDMQATKLTTTNLVATITSISNLQLTNGTLTNTLTTNSSISNSRIIDSIIDNEFVINSSIQNCIMSNNFSFGATINNLHATNTTLASISSPSINCNNITANSAYIPYINNETMATTNINCQKIITSNVFSDNITCGQLKVINNISCAGDITVSNLKGNGNTLFSSGSFKVFANSNEIELNANDSIILNGDTLDLTGEASLSLNSFTTISLNSVLDVNVVSSGFTVNALAMNVNVASITEQLVANRSTIFVAPANCSTTLIGSGIWSVSTIAGAISMNITGAGDIDMRTGFGSIRGTVTGGFIDFKTLAGDIDLNSGINVNLEALQQIKLFAPETKIFFKTKTEDLSANLFTCASNYLNTINSTISNITTISSSNIYSNNINSNSIQCVSLLVSTGSLFCNNVYSNGDLDVNGIVECNNLLVSNGNLLVSGGSVSCGNLYSNGDLDVNGIVECNNLLVSTGNLYVSGGSVSCGNIYSNQTLFIPSISGANLSMNNITCNNLLVSTGNLYVSGGNISCGNIYSNQTLFIPNISGSNLSMTNITISNTLLSNYIGATTAEFTFLNVFDTTGSNSGTIRYNLGRLRFDTVNITDANFNFMTSTFGSINFCNATLGTFNGVSISSGNIDILNTSSGNCKITNLTVSNNIQTPYIGATTAEIRDLNIFNSSSNFAKIRYDVDKNFTISSGSAISFYSNALGINCIPGDDITIVSQAFENCVINMSPSNSGNFNGMYIYFSETAGNVNSFGYNADSDFMELDTYRDFRIRSLTDGTTRFLFKTSGNFQIQNGVGLSLTDPTLLIQTKGTGFKYGLMNTNPDMVATDNLLHFIGKNTSVRNGVFQWFEYASESSGNNRLHWDFNGYNNAFVVQADGGVGMGGITNPAYILQLGSDSAAKPSTSTWTISSDSRLKKDIKVHVESSLDIINSLEFKKFKYTDPENPKEYLGLMADDVLTNEQLKNCVSKTKYKKVKTNGKIRDSPDYQETIVEEIDDALGLDYHEIFVHGLASIKELSNQNKQLMDEIKELKNEIKQLKKK